MSRNFPIILLLIATMTLSSCGVLGGASRLVKSAPAKASGMVRSAPYKAKGLPYKAKGLVNGTMGNLRGAVAGTKNITRKATNTAAQGAAIAVPIAATVATGGL